MSAMPIRPGQPGYVGSSSQQRDQLLQLLGLGGLTAHQAAPMEEIPETYDPNDIQVSGAQQPTAPPTPLLINPPEEIPPPRSLGNAQYIEEILAAQENNPQRKGMFGVKGTLRDILGVLGDGLSAGAGGDPRYAPQRDYERRSDALAGFTADPLAALERLAGVPGEKNAELASTIYNNMATQQSARERTRLAGDKEGDERYRQYANLFSSYGDGASPENYEKIKPLLRMFKERGKLGPEFEVPDEYDEAYFRGVGRGSMKVSQQYQADLGRDRLGETGRHNRATESIGQQNAASNRIRAERSGGGGSAKLPTDVSIAAPIIDKMGKVGWEGLTRNEQQILEATGRSPQRRGVGRQSAIDRLRNKNGSGTSANPATAAPATGGWKVIRRPNE